MKCNGCGSTDIDVDPARGDAVCTNCGSVLESNIIVSDIQFEENAHGGASAIGQFVSSDSKGGGSFGGGHGAGYGQITSALGRESRETTLRNARKKIEALAHQLSLRRDRIDMAFHFYKLALARNLTRGRKHTHVIAACLYITCRTEGTSHMLIDFSDVLQIDVYELGRTYLKLSQALCINIPAMDPCLYVMRFAHKLELGEKTHEVSMTALRLVSRMKKDWIHFGRRPSGLCGAALLIAARLYDFNRTIEDMVKVVKLHESTLRKRLNEFGATTTALLTLDEFANVDLESMTEEEDPPAFKAARKKDKERLQRLEQDGLLENELSELEQRIEDELDKLRAKQLKRANPQQAKLLSSGSGRDSDLDSECELAIENRDTEAFIAQETLTTISELVSSDQNEDRALMPPPKCSTSDVPGLGLRGTIQEYLMPLPSSSNNQSSDDKRKQNSHQQNGADDNDDDEDGELDLTGIDDNEIDGYIMNEKEIKFKTSMWMKVNADYLKEKAEKEEKERLLREEAEKEGKPLKKRAQYKKKPKTEKGHNQSALEAIEKIAQEKKISTKINYEVLKSLGIPSTPKVENHESSKEPCGSDSIFGGSPLPPPNVERLVSPLYTKQRDQNRQNSTSVEQVAKPEQKKEATSKRELENKGSQGSTTVPDSKRHKADHPELGANDVVVEEGPVVPDHTPADDDHLDDDELEDEDDEEHLTASQLLRRHRADEFEEEEFDDEYY